MTLIKDLILRNIGCLLLFSTWLIGFAYGANETAAGNTSDRATIVCSAIVIAMNVIFMCAAVVI